MTDTPTPSDAAAATPPEDTSLPQEYVADVSFEAMGLSEPLRRAVAERGYNRPTPVQARAFSPALQGRDLIVRSKTGTGKTAAFSLPILERISGDERRDVLLADSPALGSRQPVDGALGIKDGIDPPHRLDGERRPRQLGQLK